MDDEIFVFLGFVFLNLLVFIITLYIWQKYNRQLYYIIKRDHSKSPIMFNYTPRTYNNSLLIQHLNTGYAYTSRGDEVEENFQRRISHIFGKQYPKIRNNEVKLYLKFLKSNARMLLICTITAFIIYTPLMIYLAYMGQPWSFWRLSNIDFVNNKYMVHILYITVWIYSVIIYFHIIYLLTDYKVDKENIVTKAQLHTIMVTGFNRSVTDPQILYDHFDEIFPNQIISSHLIMDYTKRLLYENQLEKLFWQLRRFDLYTDNLCVPRDPIPLNVLAVPSIDNETLSAQSSLQPSQRLLAIPSVDLYNYDNYPERKSIILRIDALSDKLRKIKEMPVKKSVGIGFISFKDARCVYKSLTDNKVMASNPNWRLEPAPHPKDIIWLNLRFTTRSIILRAIIFNLLFISFYIAVTYTMARLNLLNTVNIRSSPLYDDNKQILPKEGDKLNEKNLKFPEAEVTSETLDPDAISREEEEALDDEEIRRNVKDSASNNTKDASLKNIGHASFWRALLPPLIMGVINSVIHPYVITLLSEYICFHRESAHQRYRLFGHIFYLITGTILVPMLSSILALWQILSENFRVLSQYLGLVMSGASWAYAAIYILNATFLSACNQLLQISQILCRWFSRTFLNYDYGYWDFDFGYWYAFHTSILTLILMFSALIPSVLPLGTIYFVMRYYIDRYNLASGIWKIGLDTTGKIGNTAIRSMLISVSLFQFGMSGIFLNCKDSLAPIYPTLLFIASVASWLLIYGSTNGHVLVPLYQYNKSITKPLAHRTLDFIRICYLHPCEKADIINKVKNEHNIQPRGSIVQ